jgi:hypothetical protein
MSGFYLKDRFKTCLNLLVQDKNNITGQWDLRTVTLTAPTKQVNDLIASKICKKNFKIKYNCFIKQFYLFHLEQDKLLELTPYYRQLKQKLRWFNPDRNGKWCFPFPSAWLAQKNGILQLFNLGQLRWIKHYYVRINFAMVFTGQIICDEFD